MPAFQAPICTAFYNNSMKGLRNLFACCPRLDPANLLVGIAGLFLPTALVAVVHDKPARVPRAVHAYAVDGRVVFADSLERR